MHFLETEKGWYLNKQNKKKLFQHMASFQHCCIISCFPAASHHKVFSDFPQCSLYPHTPPTTHIHTHRSVTHGDVSDLCMDAAEQLKGASGLFLSVAEM